MSCQVEQIADCGDILSLARALFIPEKEDTTWLAQCNISLSSCGNLLGIAYKNRLCILTSQWISSTDSNTFLISWSGSVPADVTTLLALSIYPSQHFSQNGPDWFCIVVGFKNGHVGFYTNTGHLLLLEKLDERPVLSITCHMGTFGTLPDDVHILFSNCECVITGSSLFPTLRNIKAQLAKVQAGLHEGSPADGKNINIRKWTFNEQDVVNDATVVGLELKNTYDHILAASTYGGYDIWYRSVPPVNTLILSAGVHPYLGFHYALEGGNAPPLQDVARVVAHKIKSALPGWLSGSSTEKSISANEPTIRSENLSMRCGIYDKQRHGNKVVVSPDRRLAAIVDNYGRVAVLDINRGHLIRLIKGCREAQCAFVQIFENDDKKLQLSTIKEIKRAMFLIIYNPKKGLIDIRLMQRGNRVAVFTATKNGLLLYNNCGLVGADRNHTHKKLNLPEHQCVLIDPDGKLKKIHIPFFFALEGEHSQKSKDLQKLREFRDVIKTTNVNSDNAEDLLDIITELKTLDIKKHCLDLLVKKFDVPPKFVASCIAVFWDSCDGEDENEQKAKYYFANVGLLTLFFRHINNDSTGDMDELIDKIHEFLQTEKDEKASENHEDMYHLLEDDNCILERLLTLAQEKDYRDQQHAKVTFAENSSNTYKDFLSCFLLDKTYQYITMKPEISPERMSNLSSFIFKCIVHMSSLNSLSQFVRTCRVDPREIIKLIITQLMNMPIDDINIDLIEKLIKIVYCIANVTEEANTISYNEISPWWQSIRDVLVEMPCPLRSMIVAMACKAVGKIFECNSQDKEDDTDIWESVSKENAKWGILIGKLEDISILSIVLMFQDTFTGDGLPKLQTSEWNINLKYVYTRGKGSVTELISKWLCGMGVRPEAIVANELMEIHSSQAEGSQENDEDPTYIFEQNNRFYVDQNPKIFKWLSLLRRQFPLSTSADYIIANMCWEYAIAWQKSVYSTDYFDAVLQCLTNISDVHIKLGLFSILWSTYIKHNFEVSCRLVNKIGRLPKDSFTLQELGSDSASMMKFLEIVTKYLDCFTQCNILTENKEKSKIEFERIWDESLPSLVEVAQNTQRVDHDILNLNYQVACTIYYQCHFNMKFSKPLETLFDIDYQYIFEALTGNVVKREINMKASDKLRNPRMKFLTKLIRLAIETITSISDCEDLQRSYDNEECSYWIERITVLSELWNVDIDFIKHQQVIALYHLGFDILTPDIICLIEKPDLILAPILAITIQRLKRSLEHSPDQPEWIVSVPPQLFKRLQITTLDVSIPAHPSLESTIIVLDNVLQQMAKKEKNREDLQNIKLAEIIIETCQLLVRRKL